MDLFESKGWNICSKEKDFGGYIHRRVSFANILQPHFALSVDQTLRIDVV